MAAGLLGLAAISFAEDAMISEQDALAAAENALNHDIGTGDAVFAAWPALSAKGVHLIHDLTGAPSYWLVGLSSGDHIVGFVRVMAEGTVAAVGLTCRTPEAPQDCPTPIFAMTEENVQEAIRTEITLPAGEISIAPLLVHDGPPGREVWWVENHQNGSPDRWIFVGTGGIYERPAGTFLGEDPLRE